MLGIPCELCELCSHSTAWRTWVTSAELVLQADTLLAFSYDDFCLPTILVVTDLLESSKDGVSAQQAHTAVQYCAIQSFPKTFSTTYACIG